MTFTGVHIILLILGLELIQTKNFLVETEDGMGLDKPSAAQKGHDYQDDGRFVSFPVYNSK